jgi:hypothetical protein
MPEFTLTMPIWGPYTSGWLPNAPEDVPAPKQNGNGRMKIDDGPKTSRQATMPAGTWGDGLAGAACNAYGAPVDSNNSSKSQALAQANKRPASTYANYRKMRNDGIVAIGRELADALVCVNTWSYDIAPDYDAQKIRASIKELQAQDTSDLQVDNAAEIKNLQKKLAVYWRVKEASERVKKMWESKGALGSSNQGIPLRAFLLSDSNRAKDFGNHTLEIVYGDDEDQDEGESYTVVQEFLQLRPDHTKPLIYEGTRKFAGVRNWGMGGEPVDLTPEYCDRFVYDAEGGDLFGRSRFENCSEWIGLKWDTRDKIRTDLNIAIGNIIDSSYPQGANDQETTANEAKAATAAIGLSRGLTVTTPNFSLADQMTMIRNGIDPSKLSLYRMKRLDVGNNNFDGFKVAIDLEDEQILFGLLTLPRSVKEAQHGAKADAEEHTDSMAIMAWKWITYVAGTAQIVTDNILEQWGLPRGCVVIKPSPLDDQTLSILKEILVSLITGNPQLGLKTIDLKSLFEKLDIKTLPDFDQAVFAQAAAANGAAGDVISNREKLRHVYGNDETKINKIMEEKRTEDKVPTDNPDELPARK